MIAQMFRDTFTFRELLFALTTRDIRVKYKQAAMGVIWVFIGPVLAILSGLMFRVVLGVVGGKPPTMPDLVAVMIKTVPWLLFVKIVGGSVTSLVSAMGLISKIYFPRHIVPLATMLSALFDFVISVVGLAIILAIVAVAMGAGSPIVLSPSLLWTPLLLILLILMACALGLLFSAANVFLRDVSYVVQLALQYGIFVSLVYFTYSEFGSYGWILLLNPVAVLLEGLRFSLVVGHMPSSFLPWIGYAACVTLVLMMFSAVFFDRAQSQFAEYG